LTKIEFDRSVAEMGNPRFPAPTPTASMFKECNCEIQDNHEDIYGIPTLEQLGFANAERVSQWPGGETQALERMQAKFAQQQTVLYKRRVSREPRSPKQQSQQQTNPDLEPETTGLSAYLNFGALSVRTLWVSASMNVDEQTTVTVHGQLLYREFFYTVAFTVSIQYNRI